MLFGDLHLDDRHKGRHINYTAVSFSVMRDIEDIVDRGNPNFIIFAGDLIGVRDKSIRNKPMLLEICMWFKRLYQKVDGNLFVVQGNHDIGQNTDFDFLHGLGLFKTSADSDFVDLFSESGKLGVRFHLVDYGKEKRKLDNFVESEDDDVSNIVVFHNNMSVGGQTNWYYSKCKNDTKTGYELSTMTNWKGCDMAIGGHIHNPSPYMCTTTIEGREIGLFYLGCPTRPIYEKNIYDSVWYMVFEYTDTDSAANYDALPIQLPPESETFISGEFIEDLDDEDVAESVRKEDLHAIIKDLMKYRIADGDPITMIDLIPNTNPRAVDIAKDYITRAYAERGITRR